MLSKKFYISLFVSVIAFVIGLVMINVDYLGKLSVFGFEGYVLCVLSGIVLLTTFAVAIVLNNEGKNG